MGETLGQRFPSQRSRTTPQPIRHIFRILHQFPNPPSTFIIRRILNLINSLEDFITNLFNEPPVDNILKSVIPIHGYLVFPHSPNTPSNHNTAASPSFRTTSVTLRLWRMLLRNSASGEKRLDRVSLLAKQSAKWSQ